MKARSERMLCGGRKVWYTIVDVDGIPIYSEHWHGQRGRDAIKKIAKTFRDHDKALGLLERVRVILGAMPPSTQSKTLVDMYKDIDRFLWVPTRGARK